MNRRWRWILLVGVCALALARFQSSYGQSGFVIQGADGTASLTLTRDTGLLTSIGQLVERITVEWADSQRYQVIAPLPAPLLASIGLVTDRVITEWADASRVLALPFPRGLAHDTAGPRVLAAKTVPSGAGAVVIAFDLDEWATAQVDYGTSPGDYTLHASLPIYAKHFEFPLANVATKVTYYYRILATDRDGNTSQSAEYSFVSNPTYPLFLPYLRR